jgi:hypothetical protein
VDGVKSNIGQADQIVRGVLGAGLIILTGLGAIDGAWKVAAVVLGSIAVFTAAAAFCPLYQLLRLDTQTQRRQSLQS